MSCQRAQGFLEKNAWQVGDVRDASKERQGPEAALKLARAVDRVVVAKGQKVVIFDMRTDAPDDDALLAHLLGPSGNLRAPTLRRGKTLLVGFNDEAYARELG